MKSRRTPQLDAVFEIVRAASDHPTADTVYARVRRVMPAVSLGTVYRNLQKLAAERRVRALHMRDRVTRYDGMVADHDHFCCERCGVVHDIDPARSGRRRAPGSLGPGYVVHTEVVTVYGLCPDCGARVAAVTV